MDPNCFLEELAEKLRLGEIEPDTLLEDLLPEDIVRHLFAAS